MSQSKKKPKLKTKKEDISSPTDLKHLQHIGPTDVQEAEFDDITRFSAPHSETEERQDNKTIFNTLLSREFQETLRNIVRDEMVNTLERERPKLLQELTNKLYPSLPSLCTACRKDDVTSCLVNKSNSQSATSSNLSNSGVIPEDPNVSHNGQDRSEGQTRPPEVLHRAQTEPKYRRNITHSNRAQSEQIYQRHISYSKPGTAIRRECLSRALQANVIAIVDRLQFSLSNLPEQLIGAGHLTEDECRMIRDDLSRKDQVRYLVSRTKSRDLQDIEKFLDLIENEVPDVVYKIREQFEENIKNNIKYTTCSLCLCSNNIDIKDATDVLWSMGVVSDGFYNEVVACPKPRGGQEQLWKSLIDICNNKPKREKQKVYGKLFEFIRRKGNFDFIVKPLKQMLERDDRIECRCHSVVKPNMVNWGSYSELSCCSPRSSTSEGRLSSFSGEFGNLKEATEAAEDGSTKEKRPDLRNLRRQTSFSEEQTIPKQRLYHAASLDMLDTITEEHKEKNIINQTLEFYKPEYDKFNFKKRRPYAVFDLALKRDIDEEKSKRYGRKMDIAFAFESNRSSVI